jgi:acyl carrier protein
MSKDPRDEIGKDSAMMQKEELFNQIKDILVDKFEIDPSIISLDARLYDELDIDSIDAVDLLVYVKEVTGKKIPPDQFKEVQTIENVVDTILNS